VDDTVPGFPSMKSVILQRSPPVFPMVAAKFRHDFGDGLQGVRMVRVTGRGDLADCCHARNPSPDEVQRVSQKRKSKSTGILPVLFLAQLPGRKSRQGRLDPGKTGCVTSVNNRLITNSLNDAISGTLPVLRFQCTLPTNNP
jgi:hypothetical protein